MWIDSWLVVPLLPPYGVRLDANAAKTTLLYSGEWRDANGFDYLRARPYDFKTGRFLRMDDFVGYNQDPQTLHKYLYTHGDPINGIDPSGLQTSVETLAVSGISANLHGLAASTAGLAVVGSAPLFLPIRLTFDLRFIVDGISQGVDGAQETLDQLIIHAREYADAVEEAIVQAAAAVQSSVQRLRGLPVFPIVRRNGPTIFAFDSALLASNPRWFFLNYLGAGSPTKARNRAIVTAQFPLPRPLGFQVDEFPYASTVQGGPGAVGTLVPAWENIIQGGLLSLFYGTQLRFSAGPFVVVPVPF